MHFPFIPTYEHYNVNAQPFHTHHVHQVEPYIWDPSHQPYPKSYHDME